MFAKTATPSQEAERSVRRPRRRVTQKGFSLSELVVSLTAVGAILSPVFLAVDSSMDTIRAEQNQTYLAMARDSLIQYAARNNGCLPFAADWEGALANTDSSGGTGYTDTGVSKNDSRAGDLPWTDLGLGDTFRDGNGQRIQYYVASQYADFGADCLARAKGEEWHQLVTYEGTVANPAYVYYTSANGSRDLFEIDDTLPAGTNPDIGGFTAVGLFLPANLLELRRGPTISASGAEKDVISGQNVFVLIAAGENINADASINLPYMRDENHRGGSGGDPWSLNQNVVDDVRFSLTRAYNSGDEGTNGDDTLLVASFLSFKSDLRSYGVKLEPIY